VLSGKNQKKVQCRYTAWTRSITLSFRWTQAAGGGSNAMRQYLIPNSNPGYLSSQVQRVDLDSNQGHRRTKLNTKLNNAPRSTSAAWWSYPHNVLPVLFYKLSSILSVLILRFRWRRMGKKRHRKREASNDARQRQHKRERVRRGRGRRQWCHLNP
jgi:hypothetical protein